MPDTTTAGDPGETHALPDAQVFFTPEERQTFYRVIEARRDMRHFLPGSVVEPAVLQRILQAAHCAPSVGLMQPWRYIRIVDPGVREHIARWVEQERQATADALSDRKDAFLRLKVEGVRECAELFVVAMAPDDGTVFGRRTLPQDTALGSVVCSIQNFWLAARAENLGVGWVSLFDPQQIAGLLGMPAGARPVAILCVGPVEVFYEKPMLVKEGWRQAKGVGHVCFTDRWESDDAEK